LLLFLVTLQKHVRESQPPKPVHESPNQIQLIRLIPPLQEIKPRNSVLNTQIQSLQIQF